jgi:hypothetical protein
MNTDSSSHPVGLTPHEFLLRLTGELERWGVLFIDVAAAKDTGAVEQILGGLVDWMGNGLIDGWLRLPIPLFERISDLTEELFQACQAYLGRLSAAPPPLSAVERAAHESAIREIVSRVRALTERE